MTKKLEYSTFTHAILKCTYMHCSGKKKYVYCYSRCFFFSDACDPSWRSTRDGMVISAFVVSIVAYIFTINLICVHAYWHNGEELQLYFYVMTIFSVTICSGTTLSEGRILTLFSRPTNKKWEDSGIRNQLPVTKLVLSIQRTGNGRTGNRSS